MRMVKIVGLTIALFVAAATAASAQEPVCPTLSTGHLSAGNATSFTYTAPEGQLISQVCVKAGSAQQGDGPEIINYDPPVSSVTFSHSTGKEISHFSVLFVPVPTPTPSETPSVTPTTPAGETPGETPGDTPKEDEKEKTKSGIARGGANRGGKGPQLAYTGLEMTLLVAAFILLLGGGATTLILARRKV